ncbi:MAG TPA: hypothetical protein VFL64_06250 [Rhizobacter sp.]|nr:hypothetical protein [Rhizobacter sp.]
MRRFLFISFLLAVAALSGCDMLGDSAEKLAAVKEAEGKAIGGACRHAGRAIEDCYAMNKKADKAAVFAGWRDMNDYMRENKIESVPPTSMAAKAAPKSVEPQFDKAEGKPVGESVAEVADKRAAKTGAGGKAREPKDH